MKRFASISLDVFIFFCLLIGTERKAYGYVDPGAGLMALQGAATAAAAFGYFLRRRIRSLFMRESLPVVDGHKEVGAIPVKDNSAKAA